MEQTTALCFSIELGGKPLQSSFRVTSLTCSSKLQNSSSAVVEIEQCDWKTFPPKADADLDDLRRWCKPGSNIKISVGFGMDHQNLIFEGSVEALSFSVGRTDTNARILIQSTSNSVTDGPIEYADYTLGEDIISYEQTWVGDGNPQSGVLVIPGSHKIRPGTIVKIAGVPTVFGGEFIVSSVSHYVSSGDWLTEAAVEKGSTSN